jgi:hypothetical protein
MEHLFSRRLMHLWCAAKFGFEFQEFVAIQGEVAYPGRYALKRG